MRTRRLTAAAVLVLLAGMAPATFQASVLADQGEGRTAAVVDNERLIAAGGEHTCAVLDTGGVQCWGNNALGQLGNGTRAATTVPVGVSGVAEVVSITAGATHTCALMYGGTVKCWGNNGSGQLGDGTTTDSLVPVAVTGVSTATAITAGGFHTCALLAGGTVKCWGVDGSGQLGDGGPTEKSAAPVTVAGISSAVAVAGGESHTCALLADGTARCWGANGSGQLGDDTLTGSSTPVVVSGITSADPAKAVAAGHSHSCVVLDSGKAKCWGLNFFGQLGIGTKGSGTDSKVPVTVKYDQNEGAPPTPDPDDLGGITAITAGQYHTCALLAGGAVRCWGQNGRGQLGNGAVVSSSGGIDDKTYATLVNGLAGPAKAVTAGGFHTCALVGAGMQCWGYDFYGQLGARITQRSTPVVVTALSGADTVSVGTDFACAIRQATAGEGHRAVCWGSNADGRLGAGPGQPATTTIPLLVTGLLDVATIDAGNGHACALPVGSATPQCWGWNETGQLGDGSSTSTPTPVEVSGLTTAAAVSAGGAAVTAERGLSCARTSAGEARCWGRNFFGQVGDGTNDDRFTPTTVMRDADPDPDTVNLVPITGVTDISAGGGHACAVVAGGEVLCWGWNGSGQLGDGTNDNRNSAVYVLTDPDADPPTKLTGATRVVSGAQHTCVKMTDGTLKCWGENGSGQLGNNSTTDRNTPVAVSGITTLDKASLMAAGDLHTCAMVESGHVYCWGENGSGQLGDNSTTDRKVPTEVYNSTLGPGEGTVLVTALSAGRTNTCARLIDTSVMCMGDNTYGQLGDGIGPFRTTPISVTTLAALGSNHVPAPVDDTLVTDPGVAKTVNVLSNDADPDSDSLSVTAVTVPAHGTASFASPNVTYTPADSLYCGPDEIRYTVSDGTASVTARIAVTVTCPPRPPTPAADTATTNEDTAKSVDVKANDTDPDGDLLTVLSVTPPAHGTTAIVADAVLYTPAADYCGPDSFDYTVKDPGGLSASAGVTLTVTCTGDAPTAGPDDTTTDEDTPITIDVLANDVDADGGSVIVLSVADPPHGSAAIVSGGVRYTPDPDFCGDDTFSYVDKDPTGLTGAGTVTVHVLCKPDQLHAVDDAATTAEDTPVVVDVLANDSDPDGNAIHVSAVTTPAHGTAAINAPGVSVTYTPTANFCGADTFSYTISDGSRTADAVVVPVAVTCAQDGPTAAADAASVAEDSPVGINVLANDVDVDGDILSVVSVTSPAHGTATITSGGFITYKGSLNYCGPDSFSYGIADGHGGSASGLVTVTVGCVNDPPLIAAIPNQSKPWGELVSALVSATDPDGDSLSYSLVSPPTSAGIDSGTGAFAWTPSSAQVGTHTLTVRVGDGTVSVDRSFTVTVQKRATSVAYTGPTNGQYSDPVSVSAALVDTSTSSPVLGRQLTLAVGGVSALATTGAGGVAETSLRLTEPAGSKTASATFAGDLAYLGSSDAKPFTVTKEDVTVRFAGRSLTLTSGTTSPVVLSAVVTEAQDGTLGNAMGGMPVTFKDIGGALLCSTTVPSPVTGGVGKPTCSTAGLALGTRVVVVSMSSPTYAGKVDVGTVVIAQPTAGTASGAGRVVDPGDSSKVDFGFRIVPQRKGSPAGELVHVYRTATAAYALRTVTPGSLVVTCTTGKPRVCTATATGAGLTATSVDLATGVASSVAGSSSISVWATDAAEPASDTSVPPDKYAANVTGTVNRTLGSLGSQLALELGNVRIP